MLKNVITKSIKVAKLISFAQYKFDNIRFNFFV